MIGLWVVAGLLTVGVLIALLRPLMRQVVGGAGDRDSVVDVFRRQLAELDGDLAAGTLSPADAASMRAEITRRMLAAAERESSRDPLPPGSPAELPWRIGSAVGIAALLPAAALGIYLAVGAPAEVAPSPAAVAGHDAATLSAAAAQLQQQLAKDSNDVTGWALLGRTLASLGRYPEARDAFRHAVALAPADGDLHAALGEMLVATAEGVVTPEAQAEFGKAPKDPRSRFYGAQAAAQRGDTDAAKRALGSLLAEAPADAPWRQVVADRLAELSPGQAAQSGSAIPGPGAEDIAAAQSMSPEQRQAMIRGMVERLAARMEQHPDDKAGWERLAHAYEVLGETGKAKAARARAAASPAAPPAAAATAASAGISGPTAQDIAAAQSMSPEQRQAMIRSMVERLAARMAEHPEDKAGWERLAHAYEVLGETDKAQAARARADGSPGPAPPSAPPPAPAAATPGPTPPSDQQAMIAGMVDRLAARLQADPSDAKGWLMLARSYRVLGREADAVSALQQANAHIDGNPDLLRAYMEALAAGAADDHLPPELVQVATRLNAVDGNEPEALWYLGLAAAQKGDRSQAGTYWRHLLQQLPPGAAERATVQQRLDALR